LQRDVDLIEEVVARMAQKKFPDGPKPLHAFQRSGSAPRFESAWRRLAAVGLNEVRTSKLLPRERFAFSEGAIEPP